MSPVVFKLPVTCRSADKVETGGFAFGAEALNSLERGGTEGAAEDVSAVTGVVPSALGPGSWILLLEKIVCTLNINHRIDGFAADANFVV